MCKKIISHMLIFSILVTGCYSWEIVQEPELNSNIRITTKDDKVYEMAQWQIQNEQIFGYTGEMTSEGRFTKMRQTKVHKKDIDKIEQDYFDGLKTLIFIGGVILVSAIITYATWDGPFSPKRSL